jgi:monofunctional biosynthetic peptidoglycan transglycosylase
VAARSKKASPKTKHPLRRRWLYRILIAAIALVLALYCLALVALVALRWVDPPFTAVQIQRRIESRIHRTSTQKRYKFVPVSHISLDFQHAVIAAEDGRFYQHHGFDWEQVRIAVEEDLEGGRARGASTITQQLVKNLFLTTSRSFLRKGVEFTLVPLAESILGKRRILELYLNVIEWGPGIYGAEAAAEYYYGIPPSRVNREQGARLAAILPAPLRRKPARMSGYSGRILDRMSKMGW